MIVFVLSYVYKHVD